MLSKAKFNLACVEPLAMTATHASAAGAAEGSLGAAPGPPARRQESSTPVPYPRAVSTAYRRQKKKTTTAPATQRPNRAPP